MNIKGSGVAKTDLERGIFIKEDDGDLVACVAGDRPVGVTEEQADEGETVSYVMLGLVEVQAAEALSPHQYVESDANGRAVSADTGSEAGVMKSKALAPSGGAHAFAEMVFNSHD